MLVELPKRRSKRLTYAKKGGKAIVYRPSSIPGRAPPVKGSLESERPQTEKGYPPPLGGGIPESERSKRAVYAGGASQK